MKNSKQQKNNIKTNNANNSSKINKSDPKI